MSDIWSGELFIQLSARDPGALDTFGRKSNKNSQVIQTKLTSRRPFIICAKSRSQCLYLSENGHKSTLYFLVFQVEQRRFSLSKIGSQLTLLIVILCFMSPNRSSNTPLRLPCFFCPYINSPTKANKIMSEICTIAHVQCHEGLSISCIIAGDSSEH